MLSFLQDVAVVVPLLELQFLRASLRTAQTNPSLLGKHDYY